MAPAQKSASLVNPWVTWGEGPPAPNRGLIPPTRDLLICGTRIPGAHVPPGVCLAGSGVEPLGLGDSPSHDPPPRVPSFSQAHAAPTWPGGSAEHP